MSLKRNEHGLLIRAINYGQSSYQELAKELGLSSKETLYRAGVEKGVRQGRPVKPGSKVDYKPGDVFVAGPTITKAAGFTTTEASITKGPQYREKCLDRETLPTRESTGA